MTEETEKQLPHQLQLMTMRLAFIAGRHRDRDLYRIGFILSAAHHATLVRQPLQLGEVAAAIERADAALAEETTIDRVLQGEASSPAACSPPSTKRSPELPGSDTS